MIAEYYKVQEHTKANEKKQYNPVNVYVKNDHASLNGGCGGG